jgi:hypothetical protein
MTEREGLFALSLSDYRSHPKDESPLSSNDEISSLPSSLPPDFCSSIDSYYEVSRDDKSTELSSESGFELWTKEGCDSSSSYDDSPQHLLLLLLLLSRGERDLLSSSAYYYSSFSKDV